MRKIFCCVVLLTVLSNCNKTTKKDSVDLPKNSEWAWENLKGKVKAYTEETYKVDSLTGAMGKKDSLYSEMIYNEKGYLLSYFQKDSTGKIVFQQLINHAKNGSMSEIMNTKNNKPSLKITLEADTTGKYTSAKKYDSIGKQDGYYTDLKTNEFGMTVAGKLHKIDGTIIEAWDGDYNKTHPLKQTSSDSSGKVVSIVSNKFDDKGDIIESTATNVGKDSTTTKVNTFKYDKYDEAGNWIQRTSYEKGKPIAIAKRKLTYFEY